MRDIDNISIRYDLVEIEEYWGTHNLSLVFPFVVFAVLLVDDVFELLFVPTLHGVWFSRVLVDVSFLRLAFDVEIVRELAFVALLA